MIQGTLKYKDIEFDFTLEEDNLKLIPIKINFKKHLDKN